MSRVTAHDEHIVKHPVHEVYQTLSDFSAYREWWPSPLTFEAIGPLPTRIGTRARMANPPWASWTVVVEDLQEASLIAMSYESGACKGTASWHLEGVNGGTLVAYAVDVELLPLWLRLASRIYDISREHTRQIDRVFAALDRRLSATGQSVSSQDCVPVLAAESDA